MQRSRAATASTLPSVSDAVDARLAELADRTTSRTGPPRACAASWTTSRPSRRRSPPSAIPRAAWSCTSPTRSRARVPEQFARRDADRRPRRRRRLPGARARGGAADGAGRARRERRQKCAFLDRAAAAAGLGNAEVVDARAEAWLDGIGTHDVVTARALAPLAVLAEYAAPLLRDGGALVAWKGRRDAAEEADGAHAAGDARARAAAAAVRSRPYPGAGRAPPLCLPRRSAQRRRGSPAGRESPANGRCSARVDSAESCFGPERTALVRPRVAATVRRDGHGLRDREPEGRGRQDDDRRQRRRLHRRGRLRDAAGRPRPAGQRDRRPRPRRRTATPSVYDVPRRATRAAADALRPTRDRAPLACCRRTPDLAGANVELPRQPGSEQRLRDALGAVRDRFAYIDPRLPAVARPADGQRAGRGRPRDRAGADRVLRARGARRPARHARA